MAKQKKEVAVINFEEFSIAQLPELNGKKEEIKRVIDANPIIEVIDNSSYELAKKSRTAVKTLRTSLEKEKKEVNDHIKKNVLEVVANEYDSLIADVKNDENARQEQVTYWEDKKEAERLEKLRLEEARISRIKQSIESFKISWLYNVSAMVFENIESFNDMLILEAKNFDRSVLAEFEILFDDALLVIRQLADSKIQTLTEQENIRLEQIRLADERKNQEEEAKRIAEEQAKERAKFEAEQKAIAEKQRIAQEKFQKEKTEFEEKQAEAKFQERKKYLIEIGMIDEGKERLIFGDLEFRYSQLKEFDEPNYQESLEYIGQKIAESKEPLTKTQEVEFEEPATENYHEEDVHEIAKPKEELTWDNIAEKFTYDKTGINVFDWLEFNYNVPTPKN